MVKMKVTALLLAASMIASAGEVYRGGLNFLFVGALDTIGGEFTWEVQAMPPPYDNMQIPPQGKITNVDPGEFVGFKDVNLREATMITASFAYGGFGDGNYVEVRLDSLNGDILDTITINNSGSWSTWITDTSTIDNTEAEGVHTLFFVFRGPGNGVGNFVAFVLVEEEPDVAARPRASVPRRSAKQGPVSIIRLDGPGGDAGIGARGNLFTIHGRGVHTGIGSRGVTGGRSSGLYIVDWRNRSLSEGR